jgi:hypothetical protein
MEVRGGNGLDVTVLRGAPALGDTNGNGAIRCADVRHRRRFEGFTLTNGHTRAAGHESRDQGGVGAWCEQSTLITNCTFVGNESFRDGGAANDRIFYGCTFRGNRAGDDSDGVDDAVLRDCFLVGNSAMGNGGGAAECKLDQCMLSQNMATSGMRGGAADSGPRNPSWPASRINSQEALLTQATSPFRHLRQHLLPVGWGEMPPPSLEVHPRKQSKSRRKR